MKTKFSLFNLLFTLFLIAVISAILLPHYARAAGADPETPAVSSVNPVVRSNAIEFVQGVSDEKNLTVSIAPSYAPNLINNDGKSDQWGACIALTYHPKGAVGQYTFAGIRLDYLGSRFWAPSIAGGLRADVQVFGINLTPIVYTGGIIAVSGGGDENGNIGVIAGAGLKVDVYKGKILGLDSKISLTGAAERWSNFDGMRYLFGPNWSLSF